MDPNTRKAEVLLEALPYLRRFYGKTFVIKYGGHAMVEEALQSSFARDVVLLKFVGIDPVIVHGGGPQIDQTLARLQIEPRFVRGMRVTDAATMDVVQMVLGGKVNKDIVALIQSHGGRAVGLSGKDGGLVRARRTTVEVREGGRPPELVDIGQVGEVTAIDPTVLQTLDRSDFIPVIAPLGSGPDGETFNINADVVAGRIAQALRAEKLILLTDVEGVKDDAGELRRTLPESEARRWIESGVIGAGMIPKVECCLDALAGGVHKTHILDGRQLHAILLEIFTEAGVGTEVVRDDAAPATGAGDGGGGGPPGGAAA